MDMEKKMNPEAEVLDDDMLEGAAGGAAMPTGGFRNDINMNVLAKKANVVSQNVVAKNVVAKNIVGRDTTISQK